MGISTVTALRLPRGWPGQVIGVTDSEFHHIATISASGTPVSTSPRNWIVIIILAKLAMMGLGLRINIQEDINQERLARHGRKSMGCYSADYSPNEETRCDNVAITAVRDTIAADEVKTER